MKTIEECIEESPAFFPSLVKLVNEAKEGGEDTEPYVFIFTKVNEKKELIVSKLVMGHCISLWGDHEDLIVTGHTLGDLSTLVNSTK